MKQKLYAVFAVVSVCVMLLSLAGCGQSKADLWSAATYTADTELGQGSTTVSVKVEAGDKGVTFTLHTDKTTVGDALLENGLIAGDEGAYGLNVKQVNGMTADYDVDKSYWAFYVGEDYASLGVDSTEIAEGVVYRLVYTK